MNAEQNKNLIIYNKGNKNDGQLGLLGQLIWRFSDLAN